MTWLVFRCHDLGAPHHVVTATRCYKAPPHSSPPLETSAPRRGPRGPHGRRRRLRSWWPTMSKDQGGVRPRSSSCKKRGFTKRKKFLYHFLMNQNMPKPWLWMIQWWYFGDMLVTYIVYSKHHSEEFWEFINRQRMELRQPKWGSLSSLHGNFTWQGRITNFNSVVCRWFIYERVGFQCHDILFYVLFLGVP